MMGYRKVKQRVESAWDNYFDFLEEELSLSPNQLRRLNELLDMKDVYSAALDAVMEAHCG